MIHTNALTIDVEDYFQVSAFENAIQRSDWDRLEHRILANMDKVLQIFSDHELKSTCFMLSWIAERYPKLFKPDELKCLLNQDIICPKGFDDVLSGLIIITTTIKKVLRARVGTADVN